MSHTKTMDNMREEILSKLSRPRLTSERVRILTNSLECTKGYHQVIRRALGLKSILESMTINIEHHELFVGNLAPEPFSAPVYPENSWKWIIEQMEDFAVRGGDRFTVPEEVKQDLREILPKWEGECVQDAALLLMPDSVKTARDAKLIGFENMLTGGIAHFLPAYDKVLAKGFSGIKKDIQEKLNELDITSIDAPDKKAFYEAGLICCDAACSFANRYADLAEKMAEKETDSLNRERLKKIASACRRVPEYGAESFYEALQSLWISHLICYINQNGLAVTLGRMDQYLYPYYQNDIKAGVIERQTAVEFLTSFWINCNGIVKLYNNLAASFYAGFPITQAPQLGGYTADGQDATNELSEIILEIEANIHLPQPDIAVLYTPKMDFGFLTRASSVVPKSMKPKFFNYETIMKSLKTLGVSDEDLKNVAFVGCVEQSVPGKTWGWHNAGLVNLAKCLELALNDGMDQITGVKLGPSTGKLSEMQSIEDVWAAFDKQVESATNLLIAALHAVEQAHREILPLPYESLLVDDCVEVGRELNRGGARYNFSGIQGIGLATVSDSLCAIKQLVFQQKKISLTDFVKAAKNDYLGKEVLLKDIILNVPKFGNDDDAVDEIAQKVVNMYCSKVEGHPNQRGGKFIPGMYSISAHVPFGKGTVKMDGSLIAEPVSDGTSPSQGCIANGPTGVAKSQAKLNHVRVTNGTLLNVKYLASQLADKENIDRLAAFIKAFMDIGGYHLQINVVDVAELKDAQKHPEKYPYLMVRVAAYVALFTQLSKDIQDEIISRSELQL